VSKPFNSSHHIFHYSFEAEERERERERLSKDRKVEGKRKVWEEVIRLYGGGGGRKNVLLLGFQTCPLVTLITIE
jgi:hypothetical protein